MALGESVCRAQFNISVSAFCHIGIRLGTQSCCIDDVLADPFEIKIIYSRNENDDLKLSIYNGACLKRRPVYVAVWPLGHVAEIDFG